ncbi:MAG: DUF2851 family protein [Flavobacterium sp.]
MKEDFLHYLWKFKKFDISNLRTSNSETITIVNSGQYLQLAGPDFFNAQIIIGNQKWAGNVEIHVKSSDWYMHNHERDSSYENVILHVVWEHDTEVFRKDNTEIPVLELRNFVSREVTENYQSLMYPKTWIFCEKELSQLDNFTLKNWQERLFFERLERKSVPIENLLNETGQDWEAVLFFLLAKNFGLDINGESFLNIAKKISFSVIQKECFELENLEALFFGFAGLLEEEKEDNYYKDLQFRFYFLLHKYQLDKNTESVQFFKHRPDNFPTIRLSQLANLYFEQHNLFSKIIEANSVEKLETVFRISVSPYWQTHYQFDRESPKKNKKLSKSFIDLLIINTIIPVQFAYAKSQQKENSEDLVDLLKTLEPEKNSIVQKFDSFGLKAENAFETQSLLQLRKEYCVKGKCLECAIGLKLIKD